MSFPDPISDWGTERTAVSVAAKIAREMGDSTADVKAVIDLMLLLSQQLSAIYARLAVLVDVIDERMP